MKKNLKEQLTALKKKELLEVKGGRQFIPSGFYAPSAPSFGIWEDAEIRFDGEGTDDTANSPNPHSELTWIV